MWAVGLIYDEEVITGQKLIMTSIMASKQGKMASNLTHMILITRKEKQ